MDKLPPIPPRELDNEDEILDGPFGARIGMTLFLVLTLAALVFAAALEPPAPITREPIPTQKN
jgi:hypothetical protein